MDKPRICILIRVYNRISDLEANLDIIRKTWSNYNYYIIISCNGENDGYMISEEIKQKADLIIKLDNNIGHLSGNSQLLLNGLKHIPNDCKYVILLEADTWVYTDEIVSRYLHKMEQKKVVWASAKWYDKCYSLATDFALVNTAFLINHQEILHFSDLPECWVANYLVRNKFKYLLIKENMPVLLPSYIKKYPYAPFGRFYVFPHSKMVTHHIEHLNGKMDTKKMYFNVICKKDFFKTTQHKNYQLEFTKIVLSHLLTFIFPRKSWFKKNIFID